MTTANGSPNSDGWVQLFNGQDLTGWKFHSDQPGHWLVQNGILKGSKRQSHLFTERGDYKNFHLRAEVKINLGGDSGILFRAPLELRPGRPNDLGIAGCYEAELQQNRIQARPTGSISEAPGNAPPTTLGRVLDGSLTEPDEWFTYEVIAKDNRFITKINGVEAANCEDPQSRHPTGHIALQVWHVNTLVQFRKIEIKELPASSPVTDGFVALFNGKDLTGWKKHSLSGGDWRVEGGAIDGRGTTSYLFSESGDYDNFHLRVEAKINGNGDAGVCFRTPFDVKGLGQTGPAKFALLEGYEAAIAARPNWANHTGSLTTADGTVLQAGPLLPHKADEWFVLEVIAEDNRIRTLVDGKSTADFKEARRFARGHIALQTWGPNITSVQFRRIEIKQLTPLAPTPSVATQWTAAELQRIAALPADQQVEEVRNELMRLNPKFNGVVTPKIENDAVTEISINTDEVENIAPVRALTKLVYLDCRGTYPYGGKLSDLSPLTGTSISRLDCSSTKVSDLRPLTGLPLTFLHFSHNPVSDLAPLKGLPLEELGLAETKVPDLSPLRGMKLKVLGAQLLLVTDISPLAGMPLTGIDLYHTVGVTKLDALKEMPLEWLNLQDVPVSDLSPLAGMATLRTLVLHATQVSDLSPLAGLKLTDLILHGQPIKDLAPLKGMPLTRLHLYETGVTDLRPLEGLPLVEVRFNPKNITHGLDVLRGLKSITTIGIDGTQSWPAADFWQRLEKEEFK